MKNLDGWMTGRMTRWMTGRMDGKDDRTEPTDKTKDILYKYDYWLLLY
jgi:hypothetical protein